MSFLQLNTNQKIVVVLISILKMFLATLLFFNPFWGILLSLLFDWIDGGIYILVGMKINIDRYFNIYHEFDKVTDLFFDLCLLLYLFIYFDVNIFVLALILFLFRVIGLILSYKKNSTKFLLFFPNIFENFAIILLIAQFFSITIDIPSILILSLLTKIPQEYFVHRKGNRNVANWTVKFYERIFNI